MRQLAAPDARDMAALHAGAFERGWEALEMAVHIQKDMCFGVEDDGLSLIHI